MTNILYMAARIAGELKRSNMALEIRSCINDAIKEASDTRFYFNEMRGVTFNTVNGTEYYADQGLVVIDAAYLALNNQRLNLSLRNNDDAAGNADGSIILGQPYAYSRYGQMLRLDPIPNDTYTVMLEGYGKLTPWPVTSDLVGNAWFTEGEQYIRALAKRNLLRDVIRDLGEASAFDVIADDYKSQLISATAERQGTGVIRPTQF